MERIAHAAILRSDNCIIFGKDHTNCIERSPYGTTTTEAQGFLTHRYRFVKRKEAAKIAFDAGQIDKWEDGQILVSEELWSKGGKHTYSEREGYVKK